MTASKTIKGKCRAILDIWINSCRRRGSLSRNTVAVGIVVLHHLRNRCPTSKNDVISSGGEIKGSRSGLGKILRTYGIESKYLKEVSTRQSPQDGQRLLHALQWGKLLAGLSEEERDRVLLHLIGVLLDQARNQLRRQNLKLQLDRGQSPSSWVSLILENAKDRSSGAVEQHLIGAKLQRRFPKISIPNFPAHAADRQTQRIGDFAVAGSVYHITATPSRSLIEKCAKNVKSGKLPVLLVPSNQEYKAKTLAESEGIDRTLLVMSIEGFVALNVVELAAEEQKDFFAVLREIVEIYNKRLAEVETDLSLQIEVH